MLCYVIINICDIALSIIPIITAQRSYASAVFGVVNLSVCPTVRPSVCHTRAL